MIIVGVETTGTNPEKHSIVSIGAVEFENPSNQFYQENRVWDGAEINEDDPKGRFIAALKLNGFTEEQVRSKNQYSLEESIRNLISWIDLCEDRTLAGHNVMFDINFLKDSIKRYKIDYWLSERSVDLHSLCFADYLKKGLIPPQNSNRSGLKADEIFDYVGLFPEPRPHNALTGAKFEAETFSRLIYGSFLFEEFENLPIPNYLKI